MNNTFLYAGQGSQFYGMGKNLYEKSLDFRKTINDLDFMVKKRLGLSIKDQMMNRQNKNQFQSITESSLAIFIFEYAATQMMIENDIIPTNVIGSSLGEICSTVAAGCISVGTALDLVIEITDKLKAYSCKGSMLAIFENPEIYHKYRYIFHGCELVAENHSKHFVISGSSKNIDGMIRTLTSLNILYHILPVEYAFHSAEIDSIEPSCKSAINKMAFSQPKCNVFSSVTGDKLNIVENYYYWEMIRKPIRFSQCIQQLSKQDTNYIDLSSDGELSAIIKYLLPKDIHHKIYRVSTPFPNSFDIDGIFESLKSGFN